MPLTITQQDYCQILTHEGEGELQPYDDDKLPLHLPDNAYGVKIFNRATLRDADGKIIHTRDSFPMRFLLASGTVNARSLPSDVQKILIEGNMVPATGFEREGYTLVITQVGLIIFHPDTDILLNPWEKSTTG